MTTTRAATTVTVRPRITGRNRRWFPGYLVTTDRPGGTTTDAHEVAGLGFVTWDAARAAAVHAATVEADYLRGDPLLWVLVIGPGGRVDQRPHSRACGLLRHDHGAECSRDCPTCAATSVPVPVPVPAPRPVAR